MDREHSELAALKRAIECYGSQSAMARSRGVKQATVWKWLHEAKRIPPEHVLGVEADTGISRHDLRSDIYPPNLPSSEQVLARHAANVACDRQPVSHGKAA